MARAASLAHRSRRTGAAVLVAAMVVGAGLFVAAPPTGAVPEAGPSAATPVADPASLVNPFIGTDLVPGTIQLGSTFPGADVPFGMVQWSPDTPTRTLTDGYLYAESSLVGYSLTHLSGTGCSVEGDVPILPTVGPVGDDPTATNEPFSHSDERASPGYYQLTAGGVETRLTVTAHSGLAEFRFPAGAATGNLLFKLFDSETAVTDAHFRVVNDEEVQGQVTTGQFCGGTNAGNTFPSNSYTLYFDMVFDHPFASAGSWTNDLAGDYLTFDTAAHPTIKAKVGLSYVSTADAVVNRATEDPGWQPDRVRDAAKKAWNAALGRVQVTGGTESTRQEFYTALYHSLLFPESLSDVNGEYRGFDGQVHQLAPGQHGHYDDFSGWDVYRDTIQLQSMLFPGAASDMVTSMLQDFAQSGQLPKWSLDDSESYIMAGDPADGIIADAYAFGARGFDAGQALADMETEATVPNRIRPGLAQDLEDGYLPIDGTYGCCNFYAPVSTQEEYDVADNSIAELAHSLGLSDVADTYAARAQNWQSVFDPATGFVQPKDADGAFVPGFDPTSTNGFAEADAYVYTAMIPFDLRGLISAEGGDAAWLAYLDQVTSNVSAMTPTLIQMGNEPSFDIPWEFDSAGAPWKTESVVRQVEDALFSDTPSGLPGNDDLGALSSWFVWSALGMYPETPGSADVDLGSAMFSSVTIHLGNGKTITENAPTAADDAPYVQALSVDGTPWDRAYLPASLFSRGGTLSWALGTTPDTAWASSADAAPPSSTVGLYPALGFVADTNGDGLSTVAPGSTTTMALGVRNTAGHPERVRWQASAPAGSGLTVSSLGGTVAVPAGLTVTVPVSVTAAPGTTPGQDLVTFDLTGGGRQPLPDVVAVVQVT